MWKRKGPVALSVSNLGLWTGLLVDFENVATRIGAMLPVLDALLPLAALAGILGGTVWVIFEAQELVASRLPGRRLKAHVDLIDEVRQISAQALSNPSDLQRAFNLIFEAKQILEVEFSIPCPGMPPTSNNVSAEGVALSNFLTDWSAFGSVLLPSVRKGNLKIARRATKNMDIDLRTMASWAND